MTNKSKVNQSSSSSLGGGNGSSKNDTQAKKMQESDLRKLFKDKVKLHSVAIEPSGEYGESSGKLIEYVKQTEVQLRSALEKNNPFLVESTCYPVDEEYVPPRVPNDKLAGDAETDGYDIDHIDNTYVFPRGREYHIPGPPLRSTGTWWCDGSVSNTVNDRMRLWLSAYLVENDLRATPLIRDDPMHVGLSNNGNGATVVTVNRHTHDLVADLPLLRKGEVPVLAIVKFDQKGLHLSNEESYYCDGEYYKGYRPGDPEPFYDMVDPFPKHGQYEGYVVQTLMEYGSYRIVLLTPGYTDIIVQNKNRGSPYLHTPKISIPKSEITLTPNHIGLWRWKEVQEKNKKAVMRTFDWTTNVGQVGTPNFWQKFAHFIKQPSEYKRQIAICSSLALSTVGVVLSPWALGGWLLVPSFMKTYDWFADRIEMKEINLKLAPVEFDCGKGKDTLTEEIIEHYCKNPIDHETGLPYGFYHVTPYSITQYPQGHPNVNYTNLTNFFQHFCSSRNKGNHHWVDLFNLAIPNSGVTILRHEDWLATFQPVHQLVPTVISSKVPFKVKIEDERNVVHTCLSGKEELRKYLMGKMGPKAVAAILSRRVVRGGVECIYRCDELLTEWIEAWLSKSSSKFELTQCWEPDLSRYKGKKYRRYHDAHIRYGPWWTESVYRLFIKLECLAAKVIEKKGGRIISPNAPEMNLLIMEFCHAFELELYGWKDNDGYRIFAKGLNYDQRAELIRNVILKHNWKYCVPIDCKNFDGHIVDKVAIAELLFFKWLGMDSAYVELLINSRVTGVASYDLATRKSGDMFTGVGNCMLMYMLLYKEFGNIRIICDGDDTLLFMDDLKYFNRIKANFKKHGFELGPCEAIQIRYDGVPHYRIPFCQMNYTYYDYDLDHDRMLNKLCNIVTSDNPDSITNKIIGKLQASEVLKNLGYKFDIDPTVFFKDFEKGYWEELKTEYSKGTENLDRTNLHEIRFRDRTAGLVGLVVVELDKMRTKYGKISDASKRQEIVFKTIRSVVRKHREDESRVNKEHIKRQRDLAEYVDLYGVRAILPYYHTEVIKAVARKYDRVLQCVQCDEVDYSYLDSLTIVTGENIISETSKAVIKQREESLLGNCIYYRRPSGPSVGISTLDQPEDASSTVGVKPVFSYDTINKLRSDLEKYVSNNHQDATPEERDDKTSETASSECDDPPDSPVYRPESPKKDISFKCYTALMKYQYSGQGDVNDPMSYEMESDYVEKDSYMHVDQLTLPVRACQSPEPLDPGPHNDENLYNELMFEWGAIQRRKAYNTISQKLHEENDYMCMVDNAIKHIAIVEEIPMAAQKMKYKLAANMNRRSIDTYEEYVGALTSLHGLG